MLRGGEGTNAGRHQARLIVSLVAISCLSIGIAIGTIIQGTTRATPEDKRLSIKSSPLRPDELSSAFARVAGQVEPSVVNITVRQADERLAFGREGTGSGVIVNSSGFIITNHHVVKSAFKITVKLAGGKEYDARVIGLDEETDLAVIKIAAGQSLPAASVGDSDRLNVGDWVLAIGSPFGLDQTVTAGIISAKDRVTEEGATAFQQFLQTDAAINPGNSGGPLVNLAGEIIGINTQIATASGVFSGIGFALPSSTAVDIYNQLVGEGRVKRGFIGVQLMTPEQAGLEDSEREGVVVLALTGQESPAAKAGIRKGDRIISINGQKIKDVRHLIRHVASLPIGSSATIVYVREGHQQSTAVRLEERPNDTLPDIFTPQPDSSRGPEDRNERPRSSASFGVTVQTFKRAEGGLGAIVTAVEAGGLGAKQGLRLGDTIIDINSRPVLTREDFLRITRNLRKGEQVMIKMLRGAPGAGPRGQTSVSITFTMP